VSYSQAINKQRIL